jgi:hypothetical protein
VSSETEAVKAVSRIPELSRSACRAAFEARFTDVRMAKDYLQIYQSLIGRPALTRATWRTSLAQVIGHEAMNG